MIVLGADTHKRSHTIAAVAAPNGELRGEQTVPVGARGFGALLRWARGLDGERVWALEDCRHVSGSLERFLIERGERVLRIPTHLTANARRSARQRGKSDPIDALNVARAALQEGLECFPAAQLDGPELDLRLLVDHRERLVGHRVELNNNAAVASARSVAGAAAAGRRPVLEEMEHQDRQASGARRADDARPDRPRRAAPAARADPGDQRARA
jgi:transposase